MKANELRIGNLVLADLHEEKEILVESICSINNDVFNSTNGEIPFSSLKPIPLTEEWLLKFGFEKVRYEKYSHEKLNKLRAYPHVMTNGFGIYLMGSYSFPHIKHVHQLQNLYFALTGEEVTIKQ